MDSLFDTGRRAFRLHLACLHILLFLAVFTHCKSWQDALMPPPDRSHDNSKNMAYSGKSTKLLNVLQVSNPVKVPTGSGVCTNQLMEHSFGYSYGQPFVGNYTPPECMFNRVILTLTVTSAGRQFDRLAIMYLNDTEIWRTSTAEPTQNGISWTYDKDASQFVALFKNPGKVIFDLGNLIDKTYTGAFNTTLVATFYQGGVSDPPADEVIPISRRLSAQNQASAFRYPDEGAITNSLTIPRNAKKAVFTVSACGQGKDEEFWWSNAPSSSALTFGVNNTLSNNSPWREIQLYIDGQLAGVAWPFPVIFTGGVVPGFWRPIVGIDAYDLREDEIDITPWLPILSDGKDHKYEIKIVGLTDDGQGNVRIGPVASNWVVTGKVFLWLDIVSDSVTKGGIPTISSPEPKFSIKQDVIKNAEGKNMTLNYHVIADRKFSVTNNVITYDGPKNASWTQDLSYFNVGNVTADGNNQTNRQVTTGVDISSENYAKIWRYPLWCKSSAVADDKTRDLILSGDINRGKYSQINGTSVFPSGLDYFDSVGAPIEKGWTLNTTQEGTASYESLPSQNRTRGSGLTEQVYVFSREYGENNPDALSPTEMLYSRHILAENGKVLKDEIMTLVDVDPNESPPIKVIQQAPVKMDISGLDIHSGLGRKYAHLLNNDHDRSRADFSRSPSEQQYIHGRRSIRS